MKAWAIVSAAAFFLMVFCVSAWAQLAVPKFNETESGLQKIQFIETGVTVYNVSWKAVPTAKDGATQLVIQSTGDNDKTGKERIEWTEESMMEVSPAGMRTLTYKKISTGAEQMTWSLKYD